MVQLGEWLVRAVFARPADEEAGDPEEELPVVSLAPSTEADAAEEKDRSMDI